MRLCYFADPQSVHTKRWLMFFSQRGHEIHLVGSRPPDADWPSDWHFHLLEPNLPGDVPRFVWAISNYLHEHRLVLAVHWLWGCWRMRRLIQAIAPDLVHVHEVAHPHFYALLSGFHPIVATTWGSDIYVKPRRYDRPDTHLLRRALQAADLVTCDADHLRQQAIACGAQPENTVLVQWGVDPAEFRPRLDITSVREKWDLANRWPVLLSPRALKPNYNIDMILQAVHRLRSRYPDVVLLQPSHPAARVSESEDVLVKLAQDLGLQGHVRWLGYVPEAELPLLYNLANVTLSVPTSDSTPVSMLEAMACGVPLVMTDLPSIREWITPGVNGYLVPTRDSDAIVKATVDILTASEEWRRAAARRNRDLVLTRANRSIELSAMEKKYVSLMNCTGSREGKISYETIQTRIRDALMWLQLLVELAPKMEDRLLAAQIAPP